VPTNFSPEVSNRISARQGVANAVSAIQNQALTRQGDRVGAKDRKGARMAR
jgi:hypothetical protein